MPTPATWTGLVMAFASVSGSGRARALPHQRLQLHPVEVDDVAADLIAADGEDVQATRHDPLVAAGPPDFHAPGHDDRVLALQAIVGSDHPAAVEGFEVAGQVL